MNIINTYLKAKHWQLFLVFFGPIILWQIFSFSFFFQNMFIMQQLENSGEVNPDKVFEQLTTLVSFFKYFIPIILLFFLIIVYWNWAITIGLQNKIPIEHRINIKRFKLFFFFPLIYGVLISFIAFYFIGKIPEFQNLVETQALSEPEIQSYFFDLTKYIPLAILFHFFAIFCSFHTIYFTAKTIKLAELKRKLKFDDFIGEFFLTWFYFIGVWILQPKINELAKKEDH